MKKTVGAGMFLLIMGCATLLCSLVVVPFAGVKPIVFPQASYLITESFTVPLEYTFHNKTLSNGDNLHIIVEVKRGGNLDINFYVMDESNYNLWKIGEPTSPEISRTSITKYDNDWVVPYDGTWYFVYDNSLNSVSSKAVTAMITKHWTETYYSQATIYRPLIPPQFSYLSVAVLLGGVAALIVGKTATTPVSLARNNISTAPKVLRTARHRTIPIRANVSLELKVC